MNFLEYAIIVAGGRGRRMNSDIPKQFIPLAGFPILMHTLKAFFNYSPEINIILVLSEDSMKIWEHLCQQYEFDLPHTIQTGGLTRFDSVSKGLLKINTEGLVAVHDGVRPLVDPSIIRNSFDAAAKYGCGVVAVPVKESLRIKEENQNKTVDRSHYWLVQTPQTFVVSKLKNAFENAPNNQFTDDASVFEHAGHSVHLIEGSYQNIKITNSEDLIYAQALLSK